jgi:hypothetical protein
VRLKDEWTDVTFYYFFPHGGDRGLVLTRELQGVSFVLSGVLGVHNVLMILF